MCKEQPSFTATFRALYRTVAQRRRSTTFHPTSHDAKRNRQRLYHCFALPTSQPICQLPPPSLLRQASGRILHLFCIAAEAARLHFRGGKNPTEMRERATGTEQRGVDQTAASQVTVTVRLHAGPVRAWPIRPFRARPTQHPHHGAVVAGQ
jgi:hypothetical protein